MKHYHIEIDGHKTYLVYRRGMTTEYAKIGRMEKAFWGFPTAPLIIAKQNIRDSLQRRRQKLRERKDKISNKESNSVIVLMRVKRERLTNQCFHEKAPINQARHVGVEIEFLSSSSRQTIAKDLGRAGLHEYVHLKSDSSVESDDKRECDGSCRDGCNCAECDENHFCDSERECRIRVRNYGGDPWEVRDNCDDCPAEYIDDCNCAGRNDNGEPICAGNHVTCLGHCPGHYCNGSDDHPNYDCNCECTCSSGEEGHEIAIVAKHNKIAEIVSKVCKILNNHNATVNKTCGLHVHLDARNHDEKLMFANLVKSQRLLYSMNPPSRRSNYYCKPNDSLRMDNYYCRYRGINPKSYQELLTIEVRLHAGTTCADKINNWIAILSKIAYAKSVKEVNKLSDIITKVNFKPELVTYMIDRLAKFEKKHGSYALPMDLIPSIGTEIGSNILRIRKTEHEGTFSIGYDIAA